MISIDRSRRPMVKADGSFLDLAKNLLILFEQCEDDDLLNSAAVMAMAVCGEKEIKKAYRKNLMKEFVRK